MDNTLERVEILSTKGQFERFLNSTVWEDIKRELMAWKEGFRLELESLVDSIADENPSTASVLTHLGDLNGRIKAVNYMLNLPRLMLTILEENEDDGSGRDKAD